jgi:hypothetical protein
MIVPALLPSISQPLFFLVYENKVAASEFWRFSHNFINFLSGFKNVSKYKKL